MFHLLLLLLVLSSTAGSAHHRGKQYCSINHKYNLKGAIAGIFDLKTRIGKEQAIAMKIAVGDVNRLTCSKLALRVSDSHRNSAQSVVAALQLTSLNKVQAVVGAIAVQELAIISAIYETKPNIPIISLIPTAITPPSFPKTMPNFIQMSNDITTHIACIVAIVDKFQWKRVTVIYEQNIALTFDPGVITLLSDSMQYNGVNLNHYISFPPMNSLPNPEAVITQELEKCGNRSSRVFVVLYASPEFASLLFKKAKETGMMEKGNVWIISDHVASFLSSFSHSTIDSMQGVIGFKTVVNETSRSFRAFNSKFRQSYTSMYPEEEDEPSPSLHALRAYDAVWAATENLKNPNSDINFIGLSGNVSFRENQLLKEPSFSIINVVGRSYKELAVWSPGIGFTRTDLGSIFWPGGEKMIPRGWNVSHKNKALKIGIPAAGACPQFVKVGQQEQHPTGIAVDVFDAARNRLPYHLNYEFSNFYGTYDEMIQQIHNKVLDGAIGDINILSERCEYAEFTHPYMRSSMVMVVPAKPERTKKAWMFMDIFEMKMWFIIPAMSLFIGTTVFMIEQENQLSERSIPQLIGDVLWFSLNLVFLADRDSVRRNLSRIILAPWLFLILMVATMYSASLTSTLTVSRLLPSVDSIEALRMLNAVVGCNENSFVHRYLTENLHYTRIKTMRSLDDYAEAFDNGEIKAAFLISPHAEVFLAMNCNRFVIAGPETKFGGLGFAFSKGNPLTEDMSEAILKVAESGEVDQLEMGMLASFNCSTTLEDTIKLGFGPFSGLIYICCAVTSLVLISYLIARLWRKFQRASSISLEYIRVIGGTFRRILMPFCK